MNNFLRWFDEAGEAFQWLIGTCAVVVVLFLCVSGFQFVLLATRDPYQSCREWVGKSPDGVNFRLECMRIIRAERVEE